PLVMDRQRAGDGRAVVCRAIVDDDHLMMLIGLRQHAADRISQEALSVEHRDHDADQRFAHGSDRGCEPRASDATTSTAEAMSEPNSMKYTGTRRISSATVSIPDAPCPKCWSTVLGASARRPSPADASRTCVGDPGRTRGSATARTGTPGRRAAGRTR